MITERTAQDSISRQALYRLDQLELVVVRAVVGSARGRFLSEASRLLTWLSNGWAYLAMSCLILFLDKARYSLLVALLCMALAFVPYLVIKPALARVRPCDRDPLLRSQISPLDRFSCPSGHCMTLAAFSIPLAHSFPSARLGLILSLLLISWARVAVGHHYPSDLILGLLIGVGVAVPISAMLL